jgi:hypothetical protein
MTSDFAMQNVMLQMGLNLLAPDGQTIRRVQQWVLRCFACFKYATVHHHPLIKKSKHNIQRKEECDSVVVCVILCDCVIVCVLKKMNVEDFDFDFDFQNLQGCNAFVLSNVWKSHPPSCELFS